MEHLVMERQVTLAKTFDLATSSVRVLNQFLHSELVRSEVRQLPRNNVPIQPPCG